MRFALLLGLVLELAASGCAHVRPLDLGGSHDGVLLYQFSVNGCTQDTPPKLPATVSDLEWSGTARDSRTHHCQGFTIYDVNQATSNIEYSTYVRVETANGCRSQIAIAASHHCSNTEPTICPDKTKGQEAAARVLKLIDLTGSSMDKFDVFDSYSDFTKWCRKRIRQKIYAKEHLSSDY